MEFKRQLVRLLITIIVAGAGVAMAADTKTDQKAAPGAQGANSVDMPSYAGRLQDSRSGH